MKYQPGTKLPPLLPDPKLQSLDEYFKNMHTDCSGILIKRPSHFGIVKLYDTSGKEFQRQPVCDCGGFKTYNSMSPEAHSSWCSSRNNEPKA